MDSVTGTELQEITTISLLKNGQKKNRTELSKPASS